MYKIYIAKNNHKYKVFNNGIIVSTPRCKNCKERELKQHTIKTGYKIVNLGDSERNVSVHRLVAKMFIENKDNKEQVNHKDGNKTNNSVSNLEWVTRSENVIHSISELGNIQKTKLSDLEKKEIIDRFNQGETIKEIAISSTVSYSTIRRIISGAEYDTKTSNGNYLNSNKLRKSGSERIPIEKKEKIKILREKGYSYGKIANEVKVSKYTVAKELGWKR